MLCYELLQFFSLNQSINQGYSTRSKEKEGRMFPFDLFFSDGVVVVVGGGSVMCVCVLVRDVLGLTHSLIRD